MIKLVDPQGRSLENNSTPVWKSSSKFPHAWHLLTVSVFTTVGNFTGDQGCQVLLKDASESLSTNENFCGNPKEIKQRGYHLSSPGINSHGNTAGSARAEVVNSWIPWNNLPANFQCNWSVRKLSWAHKNVTNLHFNLKSSGCKLSRIQSLACG